MIIIYIDIILLVILLCLVVFTCAYCLYRVYSLQRDGQVTVLLRPTKVLFSHRKDGGSAPELKTVVAYQNPFTGDYCVRASRLPAASPDSGLSDEYEPLHEPREREDPLVKPPQVPRRNDDTVSDNTLNKTWNWNYTEYQI